MRVKSTTIALAAMLALPVVAFGQSTSTTPSGAPPSGPASRPPSTVSPAPSGPSSSTATYTTADQMMRASKVIGATVYNDQNETVGSVSELLIDNNKHDVSGVVLSVGGFLGMNSKLVKVQPTDIHVTGDKLVMSGMSKDKLKEMPDYKIVPASAS